MEEARARMIVPRDHGWFKIDTIVRYFFPGSGGSSNRPIRTTSRRSVREGRTRARYERRHVDDFQPGDVRLELVELYLVLLRDSGAQTFRRHCTDASFVHCYECRAVWREACKGASADAKHGEEE